jgi:hypothetical protein
MEFPFDCERLLKCDEDGFSIINSNSRKYIPENSVYDIDNIIRTLGKLSSSQRHLDFIATTPENFFLDNINETIIIKAKNNFVIGFIRFGFKKILLRNYKNYTKNFIKKLLTIIDFYVYFDVQRKHYGKEIFDKVIKMYNIQPYYMAYDIPNKIMYNFLFKNYLIGNPIQQDNDIVVYNEFIDENEEKGKTQSNNIKNLTINVNDNNKINYNNDNYNNSNVKDLDNKNINYNFFDYNNEEKNNDEDYQTEYSDNYKFINQNLYNKNNLNENKKNEIIEEGNIEDNFILLANGGELPIEFINEKEEEDKKEEDKKENENNKNNNENIANKYTKSNQYKYISKEEIDYVFKKFEEEEKKKKNNKNNNISEEEDEEYEDYELDEEALNDYNRDDLNENKKEEKNKENDLFYPNIKIEYINKNDEPNPFANEEEKKKLKKKRQNKKEFKKSKSKQYAIDKEENYTDDSFTTGELDNKITDKINIEKTLELYNNLNENEEINEDKINKEIEENYIFEPKIKENINEVEYKIKNLPKSVKEVKKEKKIKKNHKNENNNNNENDENNNNNNEFDDDLKKEGINDKKLRKKLLKMERREKRIEKKKLKNLFKEEKKHQEQIIANTNKIIRYGLSVKDL